jgi:hypothetical protein
LKVWSKTINYSQIHQITIQKFAIRKNIFLVHPRENQAQIWQGLVSTYMINSFSIRKGTVDINMLNSVRDLVRTRQ